MLPAAVSTLTREVLTLQLRRALNFEDTIIGGSDLYTDPCALIGEMNSPAAAMQVWHLCSQAVFLGQDRLLLLSAASIDTWQPILDALIQADPETAFTKIRSKATVNGGRP